MKDFLILTGPTGIGKSYFGLRCAKHFNCSIFSVDSMLVYKGLDIGTAKPSKEEMKDVKHYCIDTVDVHQNYDVSNYIDEVNHSYKIEKGNLFGVGGTPFYINALQKGISNIETNPHFEDYFNNFETPELMRWLQRLDPKRALELHINDRFRLTRALQITLSQGKQASKFAMGLKKNENNITTIALTAPRNLMHELLKKRIDKMFDDGLYQEANALYKENNISRSAKAAVGYKELFQHFDGEIELEQAKEKILIATRRLLKHQMTWFRKMNVQWVDVNFDNLDSTFDTLVPLLESHFANLNKGNHTT